MSDLIRRSDAIQAVTEYIGSDFPTEEMARENATMLIETIPSIEPKRGEWIEWVDCEGEVFWKCSACGQVSEAYAAFKIYAYCPFCGARMEAVTHLPHIKRLKGADDE